MESSLYISLNVIVLRQIQDFRNGRRGAEAWKHKKYLWGVPGNFRILTVGLRNAISSILF